MVVAEVVDVSLITLIRILLQHAVNLQCNCLTGGFKFQSHGESKKLQRFAPTPFSVSPLQHAKDR